jgi:hypothetical protein
MQDTQTHLKKHRVQIVECELIRDLAADQAKRELFDKLAQRFAVLASESSALLPRRNQHS